MSSKALIGIVVLIAAVAGLVFWGWQSSQSAQAPVSEETHPIVYYYGAECPHCHVVAKFLDENKIAEKVDFKKKEVWHDAANSRELERRAKDLCGLDRKQLAVPFLIAEGECLIGETDVIGFFKKKAGIQ